MAAALSLEYITPFTLTFQIDTDNGSHAMIKLADVPTPPSDQWWKDVRRLDIYTNKAKLGFELHDGSDPADLYRDMAEACIESGVCDSFSTWGVGDNDSWWTCTEWPWCVKLPTPAHSCSTKTTSQSRPSLPCMMLLRRELPHPAARIDRTYESSRLALLSNALYFP